MYRFLNEQICRSDGRWVSYILTRLFQVGIFLAFINVIAQTGTFAVIAGVAENAPAFIVVPVAIFNRDFNWDSSWGLGSVLTLVLPVAVSLNFPPLVRFCSNGCWFR